MKDDANAPWHRVASLAALERDRPHGAVVGNVDLVLVCHAGGVSAFDDACPHEGTLLSEGDLVDGQLVCRAHGWSFDATTGKRCDGPPGRLRAHATRIDGDDVLVQIGKKPETSITSSKLRRVAHLPGPRGLPLLGNALQIDLPHIHEILEGWVKQYGSLFKVSLVGQLSLVVADAQLSEQVLRARPQSVRRIKPIELVFTELGTNGVFSAEGAAWREQRRLALQALANRHLRGFFPTLRRVAERLDARWQKSTNAEIDIQDDLMRFTVDVTTSLVFSRDVNTLDGGDDVLQRHLSHVFPAMARRLFAIVPYWRFFRLPQDRALDRALAEIRRVQDQLVADTKARLAERSASDTEPRDFLEAMLLARDEQGQPFADEVIYGNMLTMLLAGEDTTAQSLAWTVHLLCERPDAIARLRQEADALLGNERTFSDFETAQNLPYLDAVVSEAMRLKPVAPFMGLEAIEDMVVGDVEVPKGMWLDLMLRSPVLDSKNFAEPASFQPERWLPERPASQAHVASASVPFGSGPRICPGRSLALLEMRVVLATLVHNFDFERIGSPSDVTEYFSFTVSPRGLRVRLRPRGKSAMQSRSADAHAPAVAGSL